MLLHCINFVFEILKEKIMDIWVDVFRGGTHTDSGGDTHEWTSDDLDTIVNLYNNQVEGNKHTAPVVLGHPETDSPSFGWVESLKKEGLILKAKLVELSEDLINGIKQGAYKFQSIALYPNLLLRHLGILGAVPPAVKGLKPLSDYFSEGDYKVIEFGEEHLTIEIVQKWMKERYGEEEVQTMIKDLLLIKKEEVVMEQPTNEVKYSEKEFNELQTKIKELENKNQNVEFDLFFNELLRDGFVIPAQKEIVKSLINPNYEFSEDGKTINKYSVMEKFIKSFPKQIEFNEIATKEVELKSETDEQTKALLQAIRGGK
jgi:hypothetical protein